MVGLKERMVVGERGFAQRRDSYVEFDMGEAVEYALVVISSY